MFQTLKRSPVGVSAEKQNHLYINKVLWNPFICISVSVSVKQFSGGSWVRGNKKTLPHQPCEKVTIITERSKKAPEEDLFNSIPSHIIIGRPLFQYLKTFSYFGMGKGRERVSCHWYTYSPGSEVININFYFSKGPTDTLPALSFVLSLTSPSLSYICIISPFTSRNAKKTLLYNWRNVWLDYGGKLKRTA